MLDQVAVLKWVKANIQQFGGDPENVTIFGQSAGGMSVVSLTASPLTRGYFRRAIVQSGGFIASGDLKTGEQGMNFAKRVGVGSIAELRRMPADEIQRLGVPPSNSSGANVSPAMPIVDGYFLTKNPREVYEAGEENTHSLMAGSDSNEGTTLVPAVLTAEQVHGVEKRYGTRAEEYFKLYPVNSDKEAWEASANAMRYYFASTALEIARFEDRQEKRAYVYYFNRRPPERTTAPTIPLSLPMSSTSWIRSSGRGRRRIANSLTRCRAIGSTSRRQATPTALAYPTGLPSADQKASKSGGPFLLLFPFLKRSSQTIWSG